MHPAQSNRQVLKQRLFVLSQSVFPSALGTIENVLETPSWHTFLYGIFATELSDARAPFISLPCIGLAPGANASPAFLPSGVEPVFFPYITLLVIVRAESVCFASLYKACFLIQLRSMKRFQLPYHLLCRRHFHT